MHACMYGVQPNTNGSQFFLTLAECTWLDKKHTIFGKARPVSYRFVSVDAIIKRPKLDCIMCTHLAHHRAVPAPLNARGRR